MNRQAKRNAVSIAVIFAVMVLLYLAGVFTWAENKAYDARMKTSARHRSPSEEISLVLLDQQSLDWAQSEFGWGWPWPRKSYAMLNDFFARGNAASLAYDMIYSEPSLYGEEDDLAFAESSRKFGRVIQTVYYKDEKSDKATKPIPCLEESAALLGNVSSLLDKSDRSVRRSPVYPVNGRKELGLSLSSYLVKNGSIDLESIPPAKEGGMYVRFTSDISRFAPYTAKEILSSEIKIRELEKKYSASELEEQINFLYDNDEEFISPYQFEDMYIFFGLYAPGFFDICATPVSSSYPGVGVHLCQLDTLLQKDFLRDLPEVFVYLLALIFITGGFLLGASISQARLSSLILKTLIMLFCCGAYTLLNYFVFVKGMILPYILPLASFVISYVTAIFELYMTEGSQRRYLKAAFRQYLSPTVIDELIENPNMLNLGGEEREITAYFSDVQGFTSISEKLSPRELTDLLNTYLSEMTDIILSYGGTIDKYEGDAIIAFWGAPTNQEDHASRAVNAALACQKKLSQMQEELTARTGKPFVQRIGLNTGKAVVGNMGSRSRFDYTMMGDTVNLASRLEGINKQFGTYTMCSENTMKRALESGCEKAFRPVAKIAVVGKKEGVRVFLPMEKADFDSCEKIRSEYDKALALFEKGDFTAAKKIFMSLSRTDAASAKMAEKCELLAKEKPDFWDGVVRATEK